MRRLLATLGVAGLMIVGTGAPALAAEADTNAEAGTLCAANNGAFIDLDGLAYVCLLPTAATEPEVDQADVLCGEHDGVLFVAVGNVAWACVLPGGDSVLNGLLGNGGFGDGLLAALDGLGLSPGLNAGSPGGGLLTGPDGLRLLPVRLS